MTDEQRTELDEVEDPGKRGPNQNEDAEVEGHARPRPLNDEDDDAEVEGHMRPRH
jgi:hypothetical protein